MGSQELRCIHRKDVVEVRFDSECSEQLMDRNGNARAKEMDVERVFKDFSQLPQRGLFAGIRSACNCKSIRHKARQNQDQYGRDISGFRRRGGRGLRRGR